jgi:uncharacterized membrane protein (DUF441 family)
MPAFLRQLLTSKKTIAAIAGVIVAAVGRVGLDLDPEAVTQIIAPIVAYIVGQGIADAGKEAVRLQAEADQQPPRT